jgi:hypothetical protein
MTEIKRRIVAAFNALTGSVPTEPDSSADSDVAEPLGQKDLLLRAAARGVEWAEKMYPTHSGEWKHHQVYAKLIKMFPGRPKWHVTGAIQRAIEATRQ